MMRNFLIVLMVCLITACCERVKTSTTESHSVSLALFSQRDAVVDAKAALAAGDKRLWAYYGRAGLIAPGVEAVTPEEVRLVDGMGDVIIDDTHLTQRLVFEQYAERYNQWMKAAKP